MRFSWTEKLALRAVHLIPRSVADAPERMLLNFACILIGLAGLLTPITTQSLLYRWPHWLVVEWSLSMMVGGISALVGMSTRRWSLERLGVLLIALSTLFYGVSLLVAFWPRGALSALIFIGIAAAKTVRFVVSSAARARLIHPTRPFPDDEPH